MFFIFKLLNENLVSSEFSTLLCRLTPKTQNVILLFLLLLFVLQIFVNVLTALILVFECALLCPLCLFYLETCLEIEIFAPHLDILAVDLNFYPPKDIVITFLLKIFTLVVVLLICLTEKVERKLCA